MGIDYLGGSGSESLMRLQARCLELQYSEDLPGGEGSACKMAHLNSCWLDLRFLTAAGRGPPFFTTWTSPESCLSNLQYGS